MNSISRALAATALLLAAALCVATTVAAEEAATSAAQPAAKSAEPAAKPAADKGYQPLTAEQKWDRRVQQFEKMDRETPPPAGAVLFAGSSTIAIWEKLQEDFKPLATIARGLGGCTVADMTRYADRIVILYKPRTIVFYAGDNDLVKKSGEQVFEDFKAFVEKVRKALPETRILFIAIKPSPSRAKYWDEAKKANQSIKEFCEKTPGLGYIDIVATLMGSDGKPNPELFMKDQLHMNRAGYLLWIPIIKAAIEKDAAAPPAAPAAEKK